MAKKALLLTSETRTSLKDRYWALPVAHAISFIQQSQVEAAVSCKRFDEGQRLRRVAAEQSTAALRQHGLLVHQHVLFSEHADCPAPAPLVTHDARGAAAAERLVPRRDRSGSGGRRAGHSLSRQLTTGCPPQHRPRYRPTSQPRSAARVTASWYCQCSATAAARVAAASQLAAALSQRRQPASPAPDPTQTALSQLPLTRCMSPDSGRKTRACAKLERSRYAQPAGHGGRRR